MAKKTDTIGYIILFAIVGSGGYLLYKYVLKKEPTPTPPPNGEPPPPPPDNGYPKEICRSPYCFWVYNLYQEMEMLDFLGISPPGDDLDTYLSKLSRLQLISWRDYWLGIWYGLNRSDIADFVYQKFNEYYGSAFISNRISPLQNI